MHQTSRSRESAAHPMDHPFRRIDASPTRAPPDRSVSYDETYGGYYSGTANPYPRGGPMSFGSTSVCSGYGSLGSLQTGGDSGGERAKDTTCGYTLRYPGFDLRPLQPATATSTCEGQPLCWRTCRARGRRCAALARTRRAAPRTPPAAPACLRGVGTQPVTCFGTPAGSR